ncbi:MAG: hypothetical protein MUD17_13740 [Gemmatimonadaceae bacterium]|jgi:hypothetical protein|nr:hypothetical protein [Gemmatimonadaceae bacterium]
MLKFFRTRAPFVGLLLLVALLVTLPGIRHPLPMAGLALLVIAGAITVRRWQASRAARDASATEESLDDAVARSAASWDARHGAPDEAEDAPSDDEPWRASLRDDDDWQRSANPWRADES